MEFTVTEKNGTQPIEDWLVPGIKEHAKKKFGIILNVEIKRDEEKPREEGASK